MLRRVVVGSAFRAAPHHPSAPLCCNVRASTRPFISKFFGGGKKQVSRVELNEALYDKTHVHYTGKIFGISVESIVYSMKLNGAILAVCGCLYLFFKGSMYLTQFSLATVGKMGFVSGFLTAVACGAVVAMMKRKYYIPPNAVYNQAIAMVLKNTRVAAFLGQYPKTGQFRAYCATGGFKLPLLRRIRSGTYELGDLLGTKPRRLQMMFTLQSADGKQGLVSCDVRKADGQGVFGSSYYFHSLAVHLVDPQTKTKESVVLVGSDTDIIYPGIMSF